MTEFIQVTVATNSQENAHQIAELLTSNRLVASVWVTGPTRSYYWWQNEVQQAEEWVCTAKTRKVLYNAVEQAIKSIHPYEVPGILATLVEAGSQGYLTWITDETRVIVSNPDERVQQKKYILEQLAEAHERLIEAATQAHEKGVTQKGLEWGPREILAHIVGWEANAIERVPRIMQGEPILKYDDDTINAIVITVMGDQSFDAVRDILRQTYQKDIAMLQVQNDNVFVSGNYVYERILAAIQHIDEHAQKLRALDKVRM